MPTRLSRRRLTTGLGFLCSLLALAVPAAAQNQKFVEIAVDDPVADWVLDEASGRVFATVAGAAKPVAVEYDPVTARPVREWPLAEKPRQLLVKAGKLVAAAEGNASVFVIDLKTNELEGKVSVGTTGPAALFASRADNPYVYALAGNGDHGSEVVQVDVLQRKVRRTLPNAFNHTSVRHVTMSADGRWALLDGRGWVSPSGATLVRFDEENLTATRVLNHHNSFGQFTADAAGRYWTFGPALYPLDVKAPLREFRGGATAMHPTYDLVVSLSTPDGRPGMANNTDPAVRGLTFQSFSKAEVLAEVQTGPPPPAAGVRPVPRRPVGQNAGGEQANWSDDPVLQFDVARDRLLAAHRGKAYVVDLKAVGVKLAPLLMMTVPSAVDASLDVQVKLPLTVSDPKLLPGTTFTVESGPKAMIVADGQLIWTPSADDVGDQKVVLKAAREGGSDSATITFSVSRPSVALGGTVRLFGMDRAGERGVALVALPHDPRQARQQDHFGNARVPTELVLVDLKAMRVTARRAIDDPVAAVAVTAAGVFVAPQNVARIQRLKLADLSDDGRSFTTGPVARMDPLPSGDLAVHVQQGGVQRFDGQKFAAAATTLPSLDGGGGHDQGAAPGGQAVSGGVQMGPVTIDPATGAVRLINAAANLPVWSSDPRGNQHHHFDPRFGGVTAGLWGRRVLNGTQLFGPDNAVVAQLGQGTSIVLEAYPAAATLVTAAEGAGQARTKSVRLEFRDLVDGARTEPLVLAETPIDPNRGYDPHSHGGYAGPRLVERNGRLLVVHEDRLFAVPLPADRLKGLPVPLHYQQRLEPVSAPVGEPLVIKPEVDGGKGTRTFDLPGSPNGTSIDPKTGAITIDTARVWKAYLETLGKQPSYQYGGATNAAGMIDPARVAFKALTGKDAGGAFPLAVHLRVTAKDEENQKAELSGYVVLLGPAKEVTDAFAAREAAARAAQEEFRRARTPATRPAEDIFVNPGEGGWGDGGPDVAALRREVEALKRQNLQLQAQIELLKELVVRTGARPAGPTTAPTPQ